MSAFLGIVTAGATAVLTWFLLSPAVANLPTAKAVPALAAVVAVSALVGFLCGSALARRARRSHAHLARFSAVTGAVWGGVLGATAAIVLLVGYISTYSAWPAERLDQMLLVLAYPILTFAGLCVGACGGALAGLLVSALVRLVPSTSH